MKIAFGMIVFNGDYVLRECLEQVYPFAHQILIAEGPVAYWQAKGFTTSTDNTNRILHDFPDPDGKIKIVHGQYAEKDAQCNAYLQHIDPEVDYLWNLDSDEVYRTDDIKKIIEFLEMETPTSVGMRSCSFYGGFERYLTGFELNTDNFLRIFRYAKGATWRTHRPPTIDYPSELNITKKHITSDQLYTQTGVQMYHYSYVFPNQVKSKIAYYKSKVSLGNCIDDYFDKVYLPWMVSDDVGKVKIEAEYLGVHEYKPQIRGECYTAQFVGEHPESISKNLQSLQSIIDSQLLECLKQEIAWYDDVKLPMQMVKGASGELWGHKLEQSPHFQTLKVAIDKCQDAATILDLGCGAADVGRVFTNLKYTGCDLPHIIEKVAKVANPNLSYFTFDAYNCDFKFCKDYDIILCNSFISELISCAVILKKILKHAKKYVVIHRQEFSTKTEIGSYNTYGNLNTKKCVLSADDFNALVRGKFNPLVISGNPPQPITLAMQRIK